MPEILAGHDLWTSEIQFNSHHLKRSQILSQVFLSFVYYYFTEWFLDGNPDQTDETLSGAVILIIT